MSSKDRSFPPPKISDLDRKSAGNFLALLQTAKTSPISLILGAGVSVSAGLPPWNTLLKKICAAFFYHWEFRITHNNSNLEKPPREMSMAFYEQFMGSQELKDMSNEFVQQNAILVAQQIKNCIREEDWRYLIRKILYKSVLLREYRIDESDLYRSLTRFCADAKNIQSIISYNWDNLVERKLINESLNVTPIWKSNQDWPKDSLPIFYPHGYLPLEGGPKTKILLAESDYHQAVNNIYSWANIIQTQTFCNSVCIFIGCSMIDPNIRRLLAIIKEVASVSNYAFLPSPMEKRNFEIMSEALFDLDLYRLGVKVIRFPTDRSSSTPYSRLPEIINAMTNSLDDEKDIWI